jgi:integrase/recombinase XerD
MFFNYILVSRNIDMIDGDFTQVDLKLIKSIGLHEMYSFITYCQKTLNASAGTRARKVVSIRQLWKYLRTKAHVIDNNIAEEYIKNAELLHYFSNSNSCLCRPLRILRNRLSIMAL